MELKDKNSEGYEQSGQEIPKLKDEQIPTNNDKAIHCELKEQLEQLKNENSLLKEKNSELQNEKSDFERRSQELNDEITRLQAEAKEAEQIYMAKLEIETNEKQLLNLNIQKLQAQLDSINNEQKLKHKERNSKKSGFFSDDSESEVHTQKTYLSTQASNQYSPSIENIKSSPSQPTKQLFDLQDKQNPNNENINSPVFQLNFGNQNALSQKIATQQKSDLPEPLPQIRFRQTTREFFRSITDRDPDSIDMMVELRSEVKMKEIELQKVKQERDFLLTMINPTGPFQEDKIITIQREYNLVSEQLVLCKQKLGEFYNLAFQFGGLELIEQLSSN